MEPKNTIYLIRHAQSLYNVVSSRVKAEGLDPLLYKFNEEFIDCGISSIGVNQAKQAAEKLHNANINVVFTSPFRRCLQTTQLIFESHPNKPKVIVWPILRERISSSCDIPTNIDELKKEFSFFDFSAFEKFQDKNLWLFDTMINESLKNELLDEINKAFVDEMIRNERYRGWLSNKMLTRYPELSETGREILERTIIAKNQLSEFINNELQTDEKVAIVSHSGFLIRFTASDVDENGAPIDGRYFNNCDVVEYNLLTQSIENK